MRRIVVMLAVALCGLTAPEAGVFEEGIECTRRRPLT